ncbi:MAG TPA: stage II sporulation protein M [Egibacteraceae bacterium]|nr:stage II sporulation protein M [Egibacteraceae bacterium]
MDVDRFIATNEPAWRRLDELARRGSRRLTRLAPDELGELVRLYQRASTHLSQARTTYRDPALTAQLNTLVARAGALIYGTRARTLRAVGRFAADTFPAALWYARHFVLVSALVFTVPAAVMGLWLSSSPAALEVAAPPALREAYVNEDFESYYRSVPSAQFASLVTTNNIRVGITAFAGGILVCALTVYILLVNGANVGAVAGLFAAAGQQAKFWGLILPHGLLEITAVFVAGASGLRLGWTLVDPGDRPRGAALVEEGRRAVVIVIGLVAVFAVAGVIEGFVTGSSLPTWARVGIGLLAEATFLVYVVARGRAAAARGLTGALGEDAESGWATAAPAT